MSYIRSGSSPEGLYIFGSKSGVEIYEKNWWENDNSGFHMVTYEDWNGIIDAYNNDEFIVDSNGLTTGEEFEFGAFHLFYTSVEDNTFKWVLSHKDGWKIEMWEVTWQYIARG